MSSPGQSLSHYRLTEPLGGHAKGELWRAEDTRSGSDVALRLLPFADDPARLARFRDEMRALGELGHPNVAAVLAVEESAGRAFVVTELVRGKTLAAHIPPGGFDIDRLLESGLALTGAVAAAHERNVVHGDLKPANVMIGEDGVLKVLDFGLREMHPAEVRAGANTEEVPTETLSQEPSLAQETLPYCSPERIQYKPLDRRSDVYSLAAILFCMATGRPPFLGESSADLIVALLRDPPPHLMQLNPAVPERLDRSVARALAKERSVRLQAARFLHEDLTKLVDERARG